MIDRRTNGQGFNSMSLCSKNWKTSSKEFIASLYIVWFPWIYKIYKLLLFMLGFIVKLLYSCARYVTCGSGWIACMSIQVREGL